MKKLLALVLCLMAMFCFAMAEDVQPIYTEDFEDGTHELYFVASPTDAENCNVTIVEEDGNKYLHCLNSTGEGENGYIQLAFGPELRNFDYTIRVRPYIKNPDHNWIKLVLRGLDGVNYNCDGYENESYLFNIWEWRGVFTIKSLSKKYSETVPMVENHDFWFNNGTWYTIRLKLATRTSRSTSTVSSVQTIPIRKTLSSGACLACAPGAATLMSTISRSSPTMILT